VVAVYVLAVAPLTVLPFFFQTNAYPLPVVAFSATLPPVQKLNEPPAVITAVGAAVTVTVFAAEVVLHPPFDT